MKNLCIHLSHCLLTLSTCLLGQSASTTIPVPSGFQEVQLWAGTPPATPNQPLRAEALASPGHAKNIQTPRIWFTQATNASQTPTPCALIIPGGGYGVVGFEYEGIQIANFLKSQGISSAILLYRCDPQRYPAPLLDARRALEILHQNTAPWKLNPKQIGVIGFSAGGHLAGLLCSTVSTTPASNTTTQPNFAVLVYPVVHLRGPLAHNGSGTLLLGKENADSLAPSLALDHLVHPQWPRTYTLHESHDGCVPSGGTQKLIESLKTNNIPTQSTFTPGNDHGFGWNRPDPKGKIRGPQNWLPQACDWILKP